MLKHWLVRHLAAIAAERGLPLSKNADRRDPDPNRLKGELSNVVWVRENLPETAKMSGPVKGVNRQPIEAEIYGAVAKFCTITDAHGTLITEIDTTEDGASDEKGRVKASLSVARTSRVQVGFMVGLPGVSDTRQYLHAKYVKARSGNTSREGSANEGQNIFYRPATCAEYAIVVNLDLYGIGFNDYENRYVLKDVELKKRRKAVVDSLAYTLMQQPGANSSQQFPHVMNFQGAIVTSKSRMPAPTISALSADYREKLERLVDAANQMSNNTPLHVIKIDGIDQAVSELAKIGNNL